MKFAAVLLVAFACGSTVAARVSWIDVVVDLQGLTKEPFLAEGSPCPSIGCNWSDGNNRGADGSAYFVRNGALDVPGAGCYYSC
jgi:hypothetical protein